MFLLAVVPSDVKDVGYVIVRLSASLFPLLSYKQYSYRIMTSLIIVKIISIVLAARE